MQLFGFLYLLLSSSEIHLQIKDPSGSPLPAKGRLVRLATGVITPLTASTQGKIDLEGLTSGRYRLELMQPGFADQILNLDLQEAQPVNQSITMRLGAATYQLDVIATAPLAGVERSRNEIPATLSTANTTDIDNSGAANLPDFLNRRLNGVYLNEIQGNPFQMDLNYRGYTASPLLGTPQGVSLYMDGVRLNQPFGDVVSWDLLPRNAIAELTLIPGSNPLFGLNTLGGTVAMETKSGRRHPGTSVQISGGSFGRKVAELEHGGSNQRGFDWYSASTLFFDDGWRQSSPTNVRQFFGKLGWQGQRTTIGLSLAFANNSLVGNGLQEQRFLDRDYRSIYTKPDITNHKSPFLNLRARHALTPHWSFSGNMYYRFIDTKTLNGDINEASLDQSLYQPGAADIRALTAAGFTGFPTSGANATNTPFPFWRCIAQVLQRDEPAEKCNGLLNRSNAGQHNFGLAGQLSWYGKGHQLTAGAAWDGNQTRFTQSTQLGYLNADRSVTGVNAFADAISGGDIDGEPFDTRVSLNSGIHTSSIYATDTFSTGRLSLTASGRYNRTVVDNRDRIRPGGGRGSLDGLHTFQRLNPALGLTARLNSNINTYLGYTEASRAPTAIELGCADPESPCRLPNAMAGDPPLKQVTTRTIEAGLRSGMEGRWRWSGGYFRSDNRNDILFVASEQTGFGYFKNFGRTRRQGLEAALNGQFWRINAGVNYTRLAATFQSPEEVNGTGNSSNESAQAGLPGTDGTIEIEPGSQIPLTPKHLGKAYADIRLTTKWTLDLGMVAVSSMLARGNENGKHQADDRYYLGPGNSPGYAIANLGTRYQLTPKIQLFLQVNNLLDRRYYSAAQLGATGFSANGNFVSRPFPAIRGEFPVQQATFFAPGAPRGAWAGLRFAF